LIFWQYYLESDPRLVGFYALALNGGCLTGLLTSRSSWKLFLPISCIVSATALVLLAFVGPPAPSAFRWITILVLGIAAGVLSSRLTAGISPALHAAPAQIANLCGAYFGGGALLATLLLDGSNAIGQPDFGPALLAVVPLLLLVITRTNPPLRQVPDPPVRNLRPLATSLLTGLIFFQVGNEWVLAVWLPFFLIHRLGTSPALAISMLAIHFIFLLLGRAVAKTLLPIVNHRRLLLAAVALSIAGYLLLATAASVPTASSAVILVGVALGPVFPIAAENLDRNFSHSSVRRLLLAAVSGAMFEPCFTGFVCAAFGVPSIMFVPALGSLAVCAIALLMLLESRLMGESELVY
jgi:hypothetical protein